MIVRACGNSQESNPVGTHSTFDSFFRDATRSAPFRFQQSFAEATAHPSLIHIPTGLGKTAMVVVGWLWQRFGVDEALKRCAPRRLVYCLPMRVLVEQTAEAARGWVRRLQDRGGVTSDVRVHALMGGEDEDDWELHPEREAIIVGTQDMLLSRALNRGYAASRSRWPMQFGLLHTDCLWVFDEIQLMGSGLATTAQLEAFRRILPNADDDEARNGHGCRSVWMSATMQQDWLKTADFAPLVGDAEELRFDYNSQRSAPGLDQQAQQHLDDRWNASKPLAKASAAMAEPAALAQEIRDAHRPGTRTIVVVNTVWRACELFEALDKLAGDGASKARGETNTDPTATTVAGTPILILLHSRFRPHDRQQAVEQALAAPSSVGTIVVSTQVIEAGVDVSATTLLTELAPWASLVQRFGRCNRRGEADEYAAVQWIDLPTTAAEATQLAAPYDVEALQAARQHLRGLEDVGLKSLPEVALPFEHGHVLRRNDLIDLFDTTPDLAGNDIDIDRFVREVEDSDVRIFWRAWDRLKGYEPPPEDEPAPRREEFCPASIGAFRDFAKRHKGDVWRWNFLEKTWEKADPAGIVPGQVFLVHASTGGYSAERGWSPGNTTRVTPIGPPTGANGKALDGTDDDRLSHVAVWQTIDQHADDVCVEMDRLLEALMPVEAKALRYAARWHDRGKAHPVFQAALPDARSDADRLWAKAAGTWRRYARRHFRHELASALAVLLSPDGLFADAQRDLVAYLIAAHHGKVRLSIRSLPNEMRPEPRLDAGGHDRRFARGVWDDDTLPAVDLGGSVIAPEVALSLEPMELGLCEQPPFAGQPSWVERMIHLRDTLGPFRLAYLEAILRAADMRASKAAEQREAGNQYVAVSNGRSGDDHD